MYWWNSAHKLPKRDSSKNTAQWYVTQEQKSESSQQLSFHFASLASAYDKCENVCNKFAVEFELGGS